MLLDDVVLRNDAGGGRQTLRGSAAVASRARSYADPARTVHPVVVNGAAGVVVVIGTIIVATFALRVISSLFRMEDAR